MGVGDEEALRPHRRPRQAGDPRDPGPDHHRTRQFDIPHATQVARITRHRTDRRTGKRTREAVYVITDLASGQASPERLAKIVRSQWGIENRLHFIRDTAYQEDKSKIRTGHGPENKATLRSHANNVHRSAGHTNIAAAVREASYEPFTRPLDLLGIA
ncbi:transposase [Streptomyces sp. MI02-7b]|nr:transposase [Streptomyces sp. MI02-7b]MDX3073985.1 transposase [Streptomyces sp. MI02-7b]